MSSTTNLNQLKGHSAVRSDSDIYLGGLRFCDSSTQTQCPQSLTPSLTIVQNHTALPSVPADMPQDGFNFPENKTERWPGTSSEWCPKVGVMESCPLLPSRCLPEYGGHTLNGDDVHCGDNIPSSNATFPCSNDFHACHDTVPLLKARSQVETSSAMRHQLAPKSFSWILCERVMKGILGAKVQMGQELSAPLVTGDKNPTTCSWSTASSDGPICRICHEGDQEGRLVRPCRCCGTLSYTHQKCLEKWLQTKNEDICELCQYQFHTRRKDRPFKEWLQTPARPRDRRNVVLDLFCFCLLMPMVFTSAWLCIHGAFYYLSYFDTRSLEAMGLIFLATILIVIFLFWSIVSLRYHCIIWNIWRKENQTVHIIVPDRTPSVVHREGSNSGSVTLAPEMKTDINGNFLWLQGIPRDAAFV